MEQVLVSRVRNLLYFLWVFCSVRPHVISGANIGDFGVCKVATIQGTVKYGSQSAV